MMLRGNKKWSVSIIINIQTGQFIKYDDIEVDFERIKLNKPLRDAISRALSIRVWHKKIMTDAQKEIDEILAVMNTD